MVTIAPELPGAPKLIRDIVGRDIRVSLGHSNATFAQGLAGLQAGATALTHTLNAMSPFQSREPGLAGLISLPENSEAVQPPYYSFIPDGHHLHPNTVSTLHRIAPQRSILITDSIEVAGLRDGVYPGHAQIPHMQHKLGNLVTIDGTNTLIGGCISLQECVGNLMKFTGCGISEAVRSATENVAGLMGLDHAGGRGVIKEGMRADLCVLNDQGDVLQTWIGGRKVWDREA
jgi:N-acetylglucosamine-6-phosphate deacetylase